MLKVRNLTKRFGGLTAVNQVSFTVEEGEIVGLIGPNGAGKTTAFNCITGFLRPDEGKVELGGKDITGLVPNLITKLGMVRTFQIVKPFGKMTVEENVAVGALLNHPVETAKKIAKEKLALVGLDKFASAQASSLPIGHRKRLEMARALATEPKVLLLDEVMGGLNTKEIQDMIETIRQLRENGLTILFIEHHMEAIMELSDRIITMHQGEKIAEGTPDEIAKHPKVMEAYFGGEVPLA
jgi:branched-chain amino acid transport system ATP-binding protein